MKLGFMEGVGEEGEEEGTGRGGWETETQDFTARVS